MTTAEQLLEQLLTYHMNYGEKVDLIQQALDQVQIEGARKMQVAAGNSAHECGYYSQSYVDDEPPMSVVHHNAGVWKARDAILALSPEAVVKGGK